MLREGRNARASRIGFSLIAGISPPRLPVKRRPIARARFPHKTKQATMTDANPPTPPLAAPTTRAKRVLASLIAGAGLDEIGFKGSRPWFRLRVDNLRG
jgi:hypothetical protein